MIFTRWAIRGIENLTVLWETLGKHGASMFPDFQSTAAISIVQIKRSRISYLTSLSITLQKGQTQAFNLTVRGSNPRGLTVCVIQQVATSFGDYVCASSGKHRRFVASPAPIAIAPRVVADRCCADPRIDPDRFCGRPARRLVIPRDAAEGCACRAGRARVDLGTTPGLGAHDVAGQGSGRDPLAHVDRKTEIAGPVLAGSRRDFDEDVRG